MFPFEVYGLVKTQPKQVNEQINNIIYKEGKVGIESDCLSSRG